MIVQLSLVPRASHCPVFHCLQYAKAEGGGLVPFIMSDVSVYLGRRRGEGPPLKNKLEALSCSFLPQALEF